MFGKCRVCEEKDKRIQDLKEQIRFNQSQLVPTSPVSHYELENDFISSGGGEEQIVPPSQLQVEANKKLQEELEQIQHEQDSILSGSY